MATLVFLLDTVSGLGRLLDNKLRVGDLGGERSFLFGVFLVDDVGENKRAGSGYPNESLDRLRGVLRFRKRGRGVVFLEVDLVLVKGVFEFRKSKMTDLGVWGDGVVAIMLKSQFK
jgi:hypothetical protein